MQQETRKMPQSTITSFSIIDILDPVKFTGYSTHDVPSLNEFLAQQEDGKLVDLEFHDHLGIRGFCLHVIA